MITKDIVMAALVRAFFKYYITGLLESETETDIQERFEPRNVKRIMLNRYEQISKLFNREAFYAISRMNYEADEIEELLRQFVTPGTTDIDLMRFACRTDELYRVMVDEYRRNFTNLLAGRIETQDEHVRSYTRRPSVGKMDTDTAENIINRLAAKAYEMGKTGSGRQD